MLVPVLVLVIVLLLLLVVSLVAGAVFFFFRGTAGHRGASAFDGGDGGPAAAFRCGTGASVGWVKCQERRLCLAACYALFLPSLRPANGPASTIARAAFALHVIGCPASRWGRGLAGVVVGVLLLPLLLLLVVAVVIMLMVCFGRGVSWVLGLAVSVKKKKKKPDKEKGSFAHFFLLPSLRHGNVFGRRACNSSPH